MLKTAFAPWVVLLVSLVLPAKAAQAESESLLLAPGRFFLMSEPFQPRTSCDVGRFLEIARRADGTFFVALQDFIDGDCPLPTQATRQEFEITRVTRVNVPQGHGVMCRAFEIRAVAHSPELAGLRLLTLTDYRVCQDWGMSEPGYSLKVVEQFLRQSETALPSRQWFSQSGRGF